MDFPTATSQEEEDWMLTEAIRQSLQQAPSAEAALATASPDHHVASSVEIHDIHDDDLDDHGDEEEEDEEERNFQRALALSLEEIPAQTVAAGIDADSQLVVDFTESDHDAPAKPFTEKRPRSPAALHPEQTPSNHQVPPHSPPVPHKRPKVSPEAEAPLALEPDRIWSPGASLFALLDVGTPIDFLVLSTFVVDPEWLVDSLRECSRFHFQQTSLTLILDSRMNDIAPLTRQLQQSVNKVQVECPPLPEGGGYGCMHAKFMLVGSSRGVRLVIASANLIEQDYDPQRWMENIWWSQDFPFLRLPSSKASSDPFGSDLVAYLKRLQVPKVVALLEDPSSGQLFHDYRQAKVHLVGSVPGSHAGNLRNSGSTATGDAFQFGVGRLHSAVKTMMMSSPNWRAGSSPHSLVYQCSSLGDPSHSWLWDFYDCACGSVERQSGALDASRKQTPPATSVVFPSMATVLGSEYSVDGGSTICFYGQWDETPPKATPSSSSESNKKQWPTNRLVNQLLCDCVSKHNPSALMHSKIGYCVSKDVGWYYLGSHNFTSAAWGWLRRSKTGNITNTIKNYELGVVQKVVVAEETGDLWTADGRYKVPIPWRQPLRSLQDQRMPPALQGDEMIAYARSRPWKLEDYLASPLNQPHSLRSTSRKD